MKETVGFPPAGGIVEPAGVGFAFAPHEAEPAGAPAGPGKLEKHVIPGPLQTLDFSGSVKPDPSGAMPQAPAVISRLFKNLAAGVDGHGPSTCCPAGGGTERRDTGESPQNTAWGIVPKDLPDRCSRLRSAASGWRGWPPASSRRCRESTTPSVPSGEG